MKRQIKYIMVFLLAAVLESSHMPASAKEENPFAVLVEMYEEVTDGIPAYQVYKQAEKEYEAAKKEYLVQQTILALVEQSEEIAIPGKDEYAEIDKALQENLEIEDEIADRITGDWETLERLDAQHKINQRKITQFEPRGQSEVVEFSVRGYDELMRLKAIVNDTKQAYMESIPYVDIGVVRGVECPLGGREVEASTEFGAYESEEKKKENFVLLKASEGSPVQAVFNGTVIATGYTLEHGYYVTLSHAGVATSYYANLSEIRVQVGQQVAQYDSLGKTGNSALRSLEGGLVFQLTVGGEAVDPLRLFGGAS